VFGRDAMNLHAKSTAGLGAIIALVAILTDTALPNNEQQDDVTAEREHLIQSLNGGILFRAYCAVCHGVDAKGNGPAAPSLKKSPADLTRISQRNGGTFPMVRVQKIISGEDVRTAAHGDREMPIWGPIFGQIAWDQDLGNVRIYNLAKHLESLQQK